MKAHPGVGVVEALGVGVAAGCRTERKERGPVSTVVTNRNPGADDDAEAVPKRMQPFDPGHVIHQAEGVAISVEPAAFQSRPRRHAGAREPTLEALVTPLAVRGVDRGGAAMAWIEARQEVTDNRRLVLLHEIPQRDVDRHAAGLDLRDCFGAVV
jgi:hypothetical protein